MNFEEENIMLKSLSLFLKRKRKKGDAERFFLSLEYVNVSE